MWSQCPELPVLSICCNSGFAHETAESSSAASSSARSRRSSISPSRTSTSSLGGNRRQIAFAIHGTSVGRTTITAASSHGRRRSTSKNRHSCGRSGWRGILVPGTRLWTPEADELLRTLPTAEVAKRTGRSLLTSSFRPGPCPLASAHSAPARPRSAGGQLLTGTPASTGVSRSRNPARSLASLLAISIGDRAGVSSLRTVVKVLMALRKRRWAASCCWRS